jgi:hypothetical protein
MGKAGVIALFELQRSLQGWKVEVVEIVWPSLSWIEDKVSKAPQWNVRESERNTPVSGAWIIPAPDSVAEPQMT